MQTTTEKPPAINIKAVVQDLSNALEVIENHYRGLDSVPPTTFKKQKARCRKWRAALGMGSFPLVEEDFTAGTTVYVSLPAPREPLLEWAELTNGLIWKFWTTQVDNVRKELNAVQAKIVELMYPHLTKVVATAYAQGLEVSANACGNGINVRLNSFEADVEECCAYAPELRELFTKEKELAAQLIKVENHRSGCSIRNAAYQHDSSCLRDSLADVLRNDPHVAALVESAMASVLMTQLEEVPMPPPEDEDDGDEEREPEPDPGPGYR